MSTPHVDVRISDGVLEMTISRPERRNAPAKLAKRLLMFTFPAGELFAWGGEPILRNGSPVGELSSVGYSAALERMVGMGFVHAQEMEGEYHIEVSGTRVPATASLKAPCLSK